MISTVGFQEWGETIYVFSYKMSQEIYVPFRFSQEPTEERAH